MEQGECLDNEIQKTRDNLNILEKRSPRFSCLVQAMVWNRKSHGLFDYESDSITRSQVCFKNSGMIVRFDDKIKHLSNNDSFGEIEDDEDDPKLLSYIRQTGDQQYGVEHRDPSASLNNRIWLVIRSLKNSQFSEDFELKPNHVIKLGRIILKVTEMNTDYIGPDSWINELQNKIDKYEDDSKLGKKFYLNILWINKIINIFL